MGGEEDGFAADEAGGGISNGTVFEEQPSVTADIVLRDASGAKEGRHGESAFAAATSAASTSPTSRQEGGDHGDHRAAPNYQPSISVGFGNGNPDKQHGEALLATAPHHRKGHAGQRKHGSLGNNDYNSAAPSWGRRRESPEWRSLDEPLRLPPPERLPRMALPGRDEDSFVESANEDLANGGSAPSRIGSRVSLAQTTSPFAIRPEEPSSEETSIQGSMEAAIFASLVGVRPRRASKADRERRDEHLSSLRGHKLKFGLQSLLHQRTPVISEADGDFSSGHSEDRGIAPSPTVIAPSPTGSVGSATRHGGLETSRKTNGSSAAKTASATTMFQMKKLVADDNAESFEESDDRILLVYVIAFLLCFLALTDLVTCLTWHLTQYKTDYVCAVPVDPSQQSAPKSSVIVVGTLLIAGNILHLLNVWAGQIHTDNSELGAHRWGGVVVHSLHKAYNFAASSGFFVWSVTILLASTLAFIVHVSSCSGRVTTTCTDVQITAKILLDVGGIAHYHLMFHALRAITLISHCLKLRNRLRKDLQVAVSMNKRRYIDKKLNFDLDLTYICDRVIAMAVPCVGGAVHRNEMSEVSRFFATNHYGRFLVFNLCEPHEEVGNGNYDNSLLYNQIVKFPFRDHHAPTLHVLMSFVKQASEWLDLSPSHVLAVHCKGGKGRTGTMISALLLWVFFRTDDKAALDYFAKRRTGKIGTSLVMQGVAAPSQIRYVNYVARLQQMPHLDYLSPPTTVITQVIFRTLPDQMLSALNVQMVIEVGGGGGPLSVVYDHCVKTKEIVRINKSDTPESDSYVFDVGNVSVAGDVVVRFFQFPDRGFERVPDLGYDVYKIGVSPDGQSCMCMGLRGKLLCFASFNTCFTFGDMVFRKFEVDEVYSKSSQVVLPEFELQVVNEILQTQRGEHDYTSEGQDNSPSHYAKMGTSIAESKSKWLPPHGDCVPLNFNVAQSKRDRLQHDSSTDSGILHRCQTPSSLHSRMNGKPSLTIEIPTFTAKECSETPREGDGSSRGDSETVPKLDSEESAGSAVIQRREDSEESAGSAVIQRREDSEESAGSAVIQRREYSEESAGSAVTQRREDSEESAGSAVTQRREDSEESAGSAMNQRQAPGSTDPGSRWEVARTPSEPERTRVIGSPPRSPVGVLLRRTCTKLSELLGLGKGGISYNVQSQWPAVKDAPVSGYAPSGYEAQPFYKSYHRAFTATFDLVVNKLPRTNLMVSVFKKGEVVFRVGQHKSRRRIAMITNGSAIWRSNTGEAWERYNIDTMSRRGWAVENGGLIGIYEYLYGPTPRMDDMLELVAESDGVKMTMIDVGSAQDLLAAPLMLPGTSLRESMDFWAVVAKQSCDKIRVEDNLARLSRRLRSVKYQPFADGDCAGDVVSQTGRVVQYARTHFKITSQEQLITTALCTRSIIVPTTGEQISVPGRLFVFTNCVVWHGVDAGQGEDRMWDLYFLLHKISSITGKGSRIELVFDTNVLDDDWGEDDTSFEGPPSESQSGEMDVRPFAASPAFLPGTTTRSQNDFRGVAPNRRSRGSTGETGSFKTWNTWSYVQDMAKSILALRRTMSTDDGLQTADERGYERHGSTKMLELMKYSWSRSMFFNNNGTEGKIKSHVFDSTPQTYTNLDLYNKGDVRVLFSFRTIAACMETTTKLQTRTAKIKARLADGSDLKAIFGDSKNGSAESCRSHMPTFRGNGYLPENFGYVLPGEKLGDGALISELFQTANRIKYVRGSMIFSRESLPSLKLYHLVSGIVHELDEEGDIVGKYYPGSICGVKLLMTNGNVVHTFSLHASTDVEMLEFNIACSHDMFHDILRKDPESAARFYRVIAFSVFRKFKPESQRHLADAETQDVSSVLAKHPKSPVGRMRKGSFKSVSTWNSRDGFRQNLGKSFRLTSSSAR